MTRTWIHRVHGGSDPLVKEILGVEGPNSTLCGVTLEAESSVVFTNRDYSEQLLTFPSHNQRPSLNLRSSARVVGVSMESSQAGSEN